MEVAARGRELGYGSHESKTVTQLVGGTTQGAAATASSGSGIDPEEVPLDHAANSTGPTILDDVDDPRTPTRPRRQASNGETSPGNYHAVMATTESHTMLQASSTTTDQSAPTTSDHETCDAEAEAGNTSSVSNASSPDGDSDNRPIVNKVSIALQRGDSTSSDSSTSNLSRASSSSSVYATPFRMTPFRTPGGGGGGGGGGSRERNSYFPALVPPRFGNRGGYSTARSSFSGALPARNTTMPIAPGVLPPSQEAAAVSTLPAVIEASGATLPGHRPSGSNVTIGPSAAAAYAAETRTPRPPPITLPPTLAGGSAWEVPQANGTSNHLRIPPSPGAELLLQASGPQSNMLMPMRPGLGPRTASTASLSNNFHKKASDFDLGEILGEGSYSTVFLATDKFPPHRQYALKVLDKKHIIKERKVKYVNVEKETLARLDRHPGVIRLYWTFHDERSLYFVLELASNGEILKYIKDYGSFEVDVARFYAAQMIGAVEHMHSKGVVHRDLKPENVLLDANMRVKLADFGTAKILSSSSSPDNLTADDVMNSRSNSFVGTAQYVSPELLTAKPLPDAGKEPDGSTKALPPPHAADFWAFGCVLYQFITGRTPFRAPNEYLIFQKITRLEYDFPPDFPPDARDLVSKLLVLDPLERLGSKKGVEEIKQHPFFASIDWSTLWTIQPPPMRTGMTPPTVFPKHVLALEESSMDASGDEGDAEESLFAPDDAEADHIIGTPPLQQGQQNLDMLPAASPQRRQGDILWPRANGAINGSTRSSFSSNGQGSGEGRPGSASTNGSWPNNVNGRQPQRSDSQSQHGRSRSASTSKWMKFLTMPRNALQRVKAPAGKRKGSGDSKAS